MVVEKFLLEEIYLDEEMHLRFPLGVEIVPGLEQGSVWRGRSSVLVEVGAKNMRQRGTREVADGVGLMKLAFPHVLQISVHVTAISCLLWLVSYKKAVVG